MTLLCSTLEVAPKRRHNGTMARWQAWWHGFAPTDGMSWKQKQYNFKNGANRTKRATKGEGCGLIDMPRRCAQETSTCSRLWTWHINGTGGTSKGENIRFEISRGFEQETLICSKPWETAMNGNPKSIPKSKFWFFWIDKALWTGGTNMFRVEGHWSQIVRK